MVVRAIRNNKNNYSRGGPTWCPPLRHGPSETGMRAHTHGQIVIEVFRCLKVKWRDKERFERARDFETHSQGKSKKQSYFGHVQALSHFETLPGPIMDVSSI